MGVQRMAKRNALMSISKARQYLAKAGEAGSIEIVNGAKEAKALQDYHKGSRDWLEVQNDFAELRARFERRAGGR